MEDKAKDDDRFGAVLKAKGGCFFLTAWGLLPSWAGQGGNLLPRHNLLHEQQGGAENTRGPWSAKSVL